MMNANGRDHIQVFRIISQTGRFLSCCFSFFSDLSLRHSCQLHPVPCSFCKEKVVKSTLTAHEPACPQRTVSCAYCSVQLQAAALEDHTTKICMMVPGFCNVIKQPGILLQNTHTTSFPHSLWWCLEGDVKGCQSSFPTIKLLLQHQKFSCGNAIIHCPWKGMGCKFLGPRSEMDQHLFEAKDSHLLLTLQSLEGKWQGVGRAMDDTKVAKLSNECSLNLNNTLFYIGDTIDVKDTVNKWYQASILAINSDRIKIHYLQWADAWDGEFLLSHLPPHPRLCVCVNLEWIEKDEFSARVAQPGTFTGPKLM